MSMKCISNKFKIGDLVKRNTPVDPSTNGNIGMIVELNAGNDNSHRVFSQNELYYWLEEYILEL